MENENDKNKGFKKDDIRKGLILAGALCIAILFYILIGKIGLVFHALGVLLKAMSPIIYGCVIAFLINPIYNAASRIFNKVFKNAFHGNEKKIRKLVNVLSDAVAIIFFIGIIVIFLWILIPQLKDSIEKLANNMGTYIDNIEKWAKGILKDNQELNDLVSSRLSGFETSFTDIINNNVIPNMDSIVKIVSSSIMSGIRFVLDFVIGIIVAMYILGSKETLTAQGKKIIYATFSKKKGNAVLDGLDYMNSVFGGFINGKIIDSIIIGILCAIFCSIVNMPYWVLISVIVGVTNIIPFFGPFIGAIPCSLLVLVESPKMCIVFIIFILALQQLDGNVIGPLILGDSTGLSGLWVLFAILVGGNLFGFIGMVLGVPAFACVYTLFTIFLREGLGKRRLTNSTEYYRTLRGFDDAGDPIRGPKKKRESAKARKKRMEAMNQWQHAGEVIGKVTHVEALRMSPEEKAEKAAERAAIKAEKAAGKAQIKAEVAAEKAAAKKDIAATIKNTENLKTSISETGTDSEIVENKDNK